MALCQWALARSVAGSVLRKGMFMLIEQRIYTTLPGRWRQYLALYEAEGLAIQQRILGRLVGYYTTELGELNQVVHQWAYRDLKPVA